MSVIRIQNPITHIPRFNKWTASRADIAHLIRDMGLRELYPYGVHGAYYYTDREGVAALLPNLILRSDLYQAHKFTCINYAFRVWNQCSERYELNTWVPVIGAIPAATTAKHAWTLIIVGNEDGIKQEDCLYFEPNDGWEMGLELEAAYQAFPIGEEGYVGELVFY